MTDRLGATAAQLSVSLPTRNEPAPASAGWRALVLAAWRALGPFSRAPLDRDAAFHARSEKFDDPAIRRMISRHRTPDEVRQDFLLRQQYGPRLW